MYNFLSAKLGETKSDKKRKKELIKLTYRDDENSITKLFAVNRKLTKLSQTTLKTWTKEKTTMPLDLHYEARNFFKFVSDNHFFQIFYFIYYQSC